MAAILEYNRSSDLAKIHIAKKDLRMSDDTYRDMLWTVARVRSAADLDAAGRRQVLDHLIGLGFKPNKSKRPAPAAHKVKLVRKIRALLMDADPRRPDTYADAMAKRMFHVERFEWCTPEELHDIVAALESDKRRREKSEQK